MSYKTTALSHTHMWSTHKCPPPHTHEESHARKCRSQYTPTHLRQRAGPQPQRHLPHRYVRACARAHKHTVTVTHTNTQSQSHKHAENTRHAEHTARHGAKAHLRQLPGPQPQRHLPHRSAHTVGYPKLGKAAREQRGWGGLLCAARCIVVSNARYV